AEPREGLAAAVAHADSSQYLTITGQVAADGSSGSLDAGFVDSAAKAAKPSDPNGNYCVRFSGPGGALGDYCVKVQLGSGGDPTVFGVRAPFPSGANRVALVARADGKELASITASSTPPTVRITSPAAGASFSAGTLDLSWTGSGS